MREPGYLNSNLDKLKRQLRAQEERVPEYAVDVIDNTTFREQISTSFWFPALQLYDLSDELVEDIIEDYIMSLNDEIDKLTNQGLWLICCPRSLFVHSLEAHMVPALSQLITDHRDVTSYMGCPMDMYVMQSTNSPLTDNKNKDIKLGQEAYLAIDGKLFNKRQVSRLIELLQLFTETEGLEHESTGPVHDNFGRFKEYMIQNNLDSFEYDGKRYHVAWENLDACEGAEEYIDVAWDDSMFRRLATDFYKNTYDLTEGKIRDLMSEYNWEDSIDDFLTEGLGAIFIGSAVLANIRAYTL